MAKNPKLGDQVVDPPDTQIAHDPDQTISVEEALKDTTTAYSGQTCLLESGQRVAIHPTPDKARQVYALGKDLLAYEHVSDHPETGEWVYRQV